MSLKDSKTKGKLTDEESTVVDDGADDPTQMLDSGRFAATLADRQRQRQEETDLSPTERTRQLDSGQFAALLADQPPQTQAEPDLSPTERTRQLDSGQFAALLADRPPQAQAETDLDLTDRTQQFDSGRFAALLDERHSETKSEANQATPNVTQQLDSADLDELIVDESPPPEPEVGKAVSISATTRNFDYSDFSDLLEKSTPPAKPASETKQRESRLPTREIDSGQMAEILRDEELAQGSSPQLTTAPSHQPVEEPPSEDHPGKLIADKYELVELAGKGGMATVWRAVSRGAAGFQRVVAMKRILPALLRDTQFVSMFIEEARVGSTLQHPNIVQINDFGVDDAGGYFLVMEWVEGLDFGRYLTSHHRFRQFTPWPLVVAIVIEALRGLEAAHERPEGAVFHRDVCPQNILVGVNGITKLSDFGLSRAVNRARMTRPDIVKGKLAYLAPELTWGAWPSVQSDIYSAGIVLWEAFAGRKLFDAETDLEVLLSVRECEIPPLHTLRPDLPPDLCNTVHYALDKDPNQRYSSTHQMGRALADVLRTVHVATHAKVIAQSVHVARQRLWT